MTAKATLTPKNIWAFQILGGIATILQQSFEKRDDEKQLENIKLYVDHYGQSVYVECADSAVFMSVQNALDERETAYFPITSEHSLRVPIDVVSLVSTTVLE